jgi:hypothetical protein
VVTVYRNGNVIALDTANDGVYTDTMDKNGSSSSKYKVCDAGVGICSAEVTVTFP